MAMSWYHTSVLFYRISYKGPNLWFRMLFEHLVYKAAFGILVWASTLLFNVGKPVSKSLQLDGIDHGQVRPMGWLTEVMYMTVAQITAEKLIANRSPWECLHTAFWKFWALIFKIVSCIKTILMYGYSQWTRLIRDPCYSYLGLEIPVPEPKSFYGYMKVEDRHIRLLVIHRDYLFRVSYYLVDVPLVNEIKYEAISYTWGDNPASEDIIVDGKTFRTTRTVGDILRRRSKLIGLWPGNLRALWIDYLCINQEDIEEKNHQVPLMHEIYQKAYRVMVYLGDGPDAGKANWLLIKLHTLAQIHPVGELSKRYMLERNSMFQNIQACLSNSISNERKAAADLVSIKPSWHALARMISHPWFNRIWIVQEIAAAKKIYVTYGGGLVEWDLMCWAFHLFANPEMTILLPKSDPVMRRDMPLTLEHGHIISYIRDATQMKKAITLTEAITMCSKFRATNPRDKVFALLGLVADDLDVRAWVDYNKSTEVLYRDTARYLLAKESHPLHVLNYAGIGYSVALENLPSWVPDWSCPPNPASFDSAPLFLNSYNASGGRNHDRNILLNSGLNVLRLYGVTVDEVRIVSKFKMLWIHDDPTKKEATRQDITTWFQEIQNLAEENTPEPYHTNQTREEALWRTFHGDRTIEGRPAPAILGEYYEVAKSILADGAAPFASSSYSTIADLNIRSSRFLAVAASTIRGRRFAVTGRGYMGWVPPLARDGDRVCVFAGAPTPFLVRPCEGGDGVGVACRLVGSCYFNGMMDGELWRDSRAEIFTLY